MTPLKIIGECHFTLERGGIELQLEALVVSDLDVDILAGIPFMSTNDIANFPSKQNIVIKIKITVHYNDPKTEQYPCKNRVRRTQAYLVRAHQVCSVVWPGCYGEFEVPSEVGADSVLAIEPHSASPGQTWPEPHITESVAGKIRVLNYTSEPQFIQRNEHVCRVQLACTSDDEIKEKIDVRDIDKSKFLTKTPSDHLIDHVTIDPDNIISPELKAQFKTLLYKHSEVFSPNLSGYNGAIGPFKASVNMVPVQPPQRNSRDKLVELQR